MRLPVETERLVLRSFEPGDLDGLAELHGDEDLVRWIPWAARDREEAAAVLERKVGQTAFTEPGGGVAVAAVRRDDGDFVGDLVLMYSSEVNSLAEIGFMLGRRHHGQGYATEGCRELLRMAYEELGMHRVIGRLESRNLASARVLERLGMRREAELIENEWIKGEWQSEVTYAMLEREWRERASMAPQA